MIVIHLIDGVLMLAMMALMFFTIKMILDKFPNRESERRIIKFPIGRKFSRKKK